MDYRGYPFNHFGFPFQNCPNLLNGPPPVPPPHINFNYHQLQQQYSALKSQHQKLLENFRQLQEKLTARRRVKRRSEAELNKCYHCPYLGCKKQYASDYALNLHIRGKHQGGNKKERDRAAKLVLKCESEGLEPPEQKIKLPPGYVQQNRIRLMLMDSSQLSGAEAKAEE